MLILVGAVCGAWLFCGWAGCVVIWGGGEATIEEKWWVLEEKGTK